MIRIPLSFCLLLGLAACQTTEPTKGAIVPPLPPEFSGEAAVMEKPDPKDFTQDFAGDQPIVVPAPVVEQAPSDDFRPGDRLIPIPDWTRTRPKPTLTPIETPNTVAPFVPTERRADFGGRTSGDGFATGRVENDNPLIRGEGARRPL